jgi:hypothetical protein
MLDSCASAGSATANIATEIRINDRRFMSSVLSSKHRKYRAPVRGSAASTKNSAFREETLAGYALVDVAARRYTISVTYNVSVVRPTRDGVRWKIQDPTPIVRQRPRVRG